MGLKPDNQIPKLLSPIKAYTGAIKVIQAGADEVYCGVRTPGLEGFELYRGASVDVPTYEELEKIAGYAHRNKVEVFVTINQPYIVDSMEKQMGKHIQRCVEAGADSLIIGDLGVLQLAKNLTDEVKFCASTYLSATNYEAVEFLSNLGFNRVILERQVPLEQIAEIAKSVDVELEVFIHGSGCSNINVNCYFYHFKFPEMDQGYMSIDGIKFPCALPYDVFDRVEKVNLGRYPIIDAYTFCSLCKLPEIIKTGVKGLKIEGRGINEEYQASTTRLYRGFLDILEKGEKSEFQDKLKSIKQTFTPLPQTLPLNNMQELCCEQDRCYYSPLFNSPYKKKLTWQAWTKLQCKLLVVQG